MSGPAIGRRLVIQQECANKLMRGHWVHDGRTPAHLDEAWSWRTDEADVAIAGETARCTLLSPEQARRRLKGKWLLIVGDSVARFIFAALLALAKWHRPCARVANAPCACRPVHDPPGGQRDLSRVRHLPSRVPAAVARKLLRRRAWAGWRHGLHARLPRRCVGRAPDVPMAHAQQASKPR